MGSVEGASSLSVGPGSGALCGKRMGRNVTRKPDCARLRRSQYVDADISQGCFGGEGGSDMGT